MRRRLGGRIITFLNIKGPEIWSNTTPSFCRWGNILRGGGRGCVRAKNVGEQQPGQTGSRNSRPCSRISRPAGPRDCFPQRLSSSITFFHSRNQSKQDLTSPQPKSSNVYACISVPKLLVDKDNRPLIASRISHGDSHCGHISVHSCNHDWKNSRASWPHLSPLRTIENRRSGREPGVNACRGLFSTKAYMPAREARYHLSNISS